MIPLYLLTGFLGAGKTSVMNSLLQSFQEQSMVPSRTAVLVNDFGSCPVDAALIQQATQDMSQTSSNSNVQIFEVTQGSIFCTCKSHAFVQGLKLLGRSKPDRIVVESSGMADPTGFDKLLVENLIHDRFFVRAVYCVIDPLQFLKLYQRLEALPRQVAGADVLIINKVDSSSEDELTQLSAILDDLNPRATRVYTSFGNLPGSFSSEDLPSHVLQDGSLVTCNTPENRPAALFLELPKPQQPTKNPITKESITQFFQGFDLWRTKGWIHLEDQIFYLSDTGRGLSFSLTTIPPGITPGITVILAPAHAQALADGWREFLDQGVA